MGYPPVISNVTNQQFTAEETSFAIPLIVGTVTTEQADLWGALDTPRTLRVTPNDYQAALEAIGMTEDDAHWKHLADIFAQRPNGPRVTQAVIGRRLTPVAKVVTVTVGGNGDGNYSIQIETQDPLVFAAAGQTATQIRDALLALLAGNTIVSAASQGADAITLTAIDAGFNFTVTLASPGDVMTQATTTPNAGIGDDMTAIRAENPDWFDILETSHSKAAILELGKWLNTNKFGHFWAETNDADVKANAAGNVAATLKALNYEDTSIRYHHTGAERPSAGVVGIVAGFQPGQIQVSHRRPTGVTYKNYAAEAGVIANFEANNVGWFDTKGQGRLLYNRTCNGGFIEMARNKYILQAALDAAKYALLSDNNITAYTDLEGVASVRATIKGTLDDYATGGGTGYIIRETIEINMKTIDQQLPANKAKLKIAGAEWSAMVRIGTNEIESSGYLSFVDA